MSLNHLNDLTSPIDGIIALSELTGHKGTTTIIASIT